MFAFERKPSNDPDSSVSKESKPSDRPEDVLLEQPHPLSPNLLGQKGILTGWSRETTVSKNTKPGERSPAGGMLPQALSPNLLGQKGIMAGWSQETTVKSGEPVPKQQSAVGAGEGDRSIEASFQKGPEVNGFIKNVNDNVNWNDFDIFEPSSFVGRFAVRYFPNDPPEPGVLKVTARIFFDFRDGGQGEGFEWDEGEIEAWRNAAVTEVEAFWSGCHTFSNDLPELAGLPPVEVEIDVRVLEQQDRNKAHYTVYVLQLEEDGQPITVKHPDPLRKWDSRDSVSRTAPGSFGSADWYEASQDGPWYDPSDGASTLDWRENTFPVNINQHKVTDERGNRVLHDSYQAVLDAARDIPPFRFEHLQVDSPEVPGDLDEKLEALVAALDRELVPPFDVEVAAYCTREESLKVGFDEDKKFSVPLLQKNLLRPRADGVIAILTEKMQGLANNIVFDSLSSSSSGGNDAESRRVEIKIGAFRTIQTTVLHEFGHIFGLEDEYPEQRKRETGDEVQHSPYLIQNYGEKYRDVATARTMSSDSIMSAGEVVEPRHYSTFLEALVKITEQAGYPNAASHWKVGGASSSKSSDAQTPRAEP